MVLQTGSAIFVPGVTGNTNYPGIDMDSVDKAAIITPGLIAFARAKKLASTPNSSFNDRTGNPVTVAGTTKTYSASLAALNSKPAITLDGASGAGPYRYNFDLPTSFTFMAVVNFGALKNGDNILNTVANNFQLAANAGGQLTVDADGGGTGDTLHSTASGVIAANTSYILGVSHDASNKRNRIFLGSALPILTVDSPVAFAGGSNPILFASSLGVNNFNFLGSWAMWAIFDKAYGIGGTSDAVFADFIAKCKSHYAV